MKKNTEDLKNLIISKMLEPQEVAKRLNLRLGSQGQIVGSTSSIVPNVEFPGKKWAVIGASIILDLIVDKIISAAFGGPAGTIWLVIQMASLFIDIVDPYGYSQALSRSDINDAIQSLSDEIKKVIDEQLPAIIQEVIPELTAKGFSEEDAKKLIDASMGFWSEVPAPMPNSSCYGDFEVFKTLSGPPMESCNSVYKKSYENFIEKNGEAYSQRATPEINEEIDRSFTIIYSSIVKNNLKTYRDSVIKLNLIVFLTLIILILLYFSIKFLKSFNK